MHQFESISAIDRERTNEFASAKSRDTHQRRCRKRYFILPTQLLHGLIHDMPFVDGYLGMAMAGGVAAIGAVIIASLIRRSNRN